MFHSEEAGGRGKFLFLGWYFSKEGPASSSFFEPKHTNKAILLGVGGGVSIDVPFSRTRHIDSEIIFCFRLLWVYIRLFLACIGLFGVNSGQGVIFGVSLYIRFSRECLESVYRAFFECTQGTFYCA